MNVVVNDLMTNYQKVGNGKTIVCLPGWGDSLDSFSELIKSLQAKYTVLALDLPGFGGSQAPPKAWDMADYTKFVADWMKKVGIVRTYGLIGHSYGGSIAIKGLASDDFKTEKLVLLASAGVRKKHSLRKKIIKAVAKTGKLPAYLLPPKTRQKLRRKFYKTAGSEALLLPHMEATFKQIISEDIQSAAKTISVPTLLIYGSKDQTTPAEDGQALHQAISGSKLEIIENAGHFLHQEQPEAVAQLIEDFLNV
ncbi:alpha/beta hydrolase [Candidatus Saccharibacteria bacterium]|nr:alpha/beta hydrolase [Candidatus Saccharibacteria bacterium]